MMQCHCMVALPFLVRIWSVGDFQVDIKVVLLAYQNLCFMKGILNTNPILNSSISNVGCTMRIWNSTPLHLWTKHLGQCIQCIVDSQWIPHARKGLGALLLLMMLRTVRQPNYTKQDTHAKGKSKSYGSEETICHMTNASCRRYPRDNPRWAKTCISCTQVLHFNSNLNLIKRRTNTLSHKSNI